MGFTDRERISQLLELFDGDIHAVTNVFLREGEEEEEELVLRQQQQQRFPIDAFTDDDEEEEEEGEEEIYVHEDMFTQVEQVYDGRQFQGFQPVRSKVEMSRRWFD